MAVTRGNPVLGNGAILQSLRKQNSRSVPRISVLTENLRVGPSLRPAWSHGGFPPRRRHSMLTTKASSEQLNSEQLPGSDMLKLFQDAQENMLFLNKQRLIAIEELQKVERDREFLMAKVAQVEAEHNASIALRETLEQRLRSAEAALEMAESRELVAVGNGAGSSSSRSGGGGGRARGPKQDPPAVWSALLLRVDSMVLSGAVTWEQAQALRKVVAARDPRAAELLEEMPDATDEELRDPLLKLTAGPARTLHVVQLTPELAPVAQAGSLGSWVLGLSRALRRKGHTCEVIMPYYMSLDTSHIEGLREHPGELHSFYDNEWHRNKIWTGTVYGIPVTFIRPLHPGNFFDRDRLYGHEDDFERFAYFSRAALEYMLKAGKRPDVLHLHDWHTAISAPLFWDIYQPQGMKDGRLLLTCHDIHYQNPQPASKLAKVGLDPGQLNRPDRFQDPRNPDLINLLKGGVVYSNKVTVVSPRYATDVRTPEFGCSLEGTFRSQGHKVVGIPSGLDGLEWDPQRDRAIPTPYSAQDDFATAKAVARSELRKRLGMPLIDDATGAERPLVACITPTVTEHELQVLQEAVSAVLRSGAQIVFVGASRSPKVQVGLEDLQREIEDPNARFVIHFEPDAAHLALAAAHVALCFSTRDPSATWPLAAMKYGALPVSRQPGEGPSSLCDLDDPRKGSTEGVGFFMGSETPAEMAAALSRALRHTVEDPVWWEGSARRAMAMDTSWDSSSSDSYVEAYWSIYRC